MNRDLELLRKETLYGLAAGLVLAIVTVALVLLLGRSP